MAIFKRIEYKKPESSVETTTDGKAFIIAIETLERVEIQYIPRELAWQRRVNNADVVIVGRNNPLGHFTGGKETMPLSLDFYSVAQSRNDVMEKINLLKAWTYGETFGGGAENVKLVFGELFREEIWRITNINVRVTQYTRDTFLPMQAYVDLELQLVGLPGSGKDVVDMKRSDVVWYSQPNAIL